MSLGDLEASSTEEKEGPSQGYSEIIAYYSGLSTYPKL
jgi:hypothetical protein